MPFVRALVGLAGIALVLATLLSAIRTVVLPRGVSSLLSRLPFLVVRGALLLSSRRDASFESRDARMALLAPLALLLLPFGWLLAVSAGFTALFWALGVPSLAAAVTVSGSSLLTLGFAPVDGLGQTVTAFAEATIGLGLVALLIAYLPTMYAAFARRESLVGLLEVRAGSPPRAVEMLTRYHRIGWSDSLDPTWERWEEWFADIDESHTSLAALAFFRSPQPDRSWVTAAGTVLDAASLHVAAVHGGGSPQAQLCIRAGYVALRRIAAIHGIRFDPDPAPDDPISVTREEFDAAVDEMAAAGIPVLGDRDRAWRDFAGWRVNYDTVLLGLAATVMAPPAPWSADRAPRLLDLHRRQRRAGAGDRA